LHLGAAHGAGVTKPVARGLARHPEAGVCHLPRHALHLAAHAQRIAVLAERLQLRLQLGERELLRALSWYHRGREHPTPTADRPAHALRRLERSEAAAALFREERVAVEVGEDVADM